MEDVEGIGFGRADELGYQLGITGNHPDRIKAGLSLYIRNRMSANRTCFCSCRRSAVQVQKLLEENKRDPIEFSDITKELLQLEEEGKIIVEDKRFYLPYLYFSEKGLVTSIKNFLNKLNMRNNFQNRNFYWLLEVWKNEWAFSMLQHKKRRFKPH